MAIVKGPAFSIEASGNVGAVNYTRWRGMSVARGAWTPVIPNTTAQQTYQGYLTTVAQQWSGTLTTNQRDAWNRAARQQIWINRLGEPYQPTGYHYFMKLGCQAKALGKSIPTSPPAFKEAPMISTFMIDDVASWTTIRIVFSQGGYTKIDADGWQIFMAGPFDTGGYTAQDKDYRLKRYEQVNGYWDTGTLTHLKWYWIRCRYCYDEGIVGNWWEIQHYKL